MASVMFVCLGNICRSPAAEGILHHKAVIEKRQPKLQVSSSGLGNWHEGELPDRRMRAAAQSRGWSLVSRAQQFHHGDFFEFDLIFAADQSVLSALQAQATEDSHTGKIHLMTAFSERYPGQEVPDPYYGEQADFELVLDMLDDACEGILRQLDPS